MTQTYIRDAATRYRGNRRPLFYDRTSSSAFTTLRELPDSALEYFSYILRKKWAADFENGYTTFVPGHIFTQPNFLVDNWPASNVNGPDNFPDPHSPQSASTGDSQLRYTNLLRSSYSNQQGTFVNYERVNEIIERRTDDSSPAPGYDAFAPAPGPAATFWQQAPNLGYGSGGSKYYQYYRADYISVPSARTTNDFQDYGYLTTYDIDRVEGSEVYLVAEEFTTGMIDGVDKFKLEASTPVNDTSLGDSHKLLVDCKNKQINLKQIGTGRSFGPYGPGRTVSNDTTYSGGTNAETDVIEMLFSDIEKRIREQEIGSVRVAAFQQQQLEADLKGLNISGNFYDFDKWDWTDLGAIAEDTQVSQSTGNSPSILVQEFNMYVNKDYSNTSNAPTPTYKNSTIKLLKPLFGTNQSDGRRLVEMELDETSDFISNFLYKIFLRRYPVYDFYLTDFGYGNTNGLTFAGTLTDTHYDHQVGAPFLSGGTYTKVTSVNFNNLNTVSKHLHFCGLRGQTGVNTPNPTL